MHRGGREEVQTEVDITQTIQCLCLAQLKKKLLFSCQMKSLLLIWQNKKFGYVWWRK